MGFPPSQLEKPYLLKRGKWFFVGQHQIDLLPKGGKEKGKRRVSSLFPVIGLVNYIYTVNRQCKERKERNPWYTKFSYYVGDILLLLLWAWCEGSRCRVRLSTMHVLFKWPSALEWRSCVLGFSLMSCRVVYALLLCRNGGLSACRCRHALGCLLVKFRFKKRKRNYRLVSFWSFRGRGRLAACDASRPPSDFEGSDSCANLLSLLPFRKQVVVV